MPMSPSASSPLPRSVARTALLLVALTATGCLVTSAAPGDSDEDHVVVADGRSWGDDPFEIGSVAIADDGLSVELSFGGGCEEHDFTLVIAAEFAESDPVQLRAEIAHNANNDPCEAYLTETRVFDLGLVRARYRDSYGSGAGEVAILIKGAGGDSLLYTFGG